MGDFISGTLIGVSAQIAKGGCIPGASAPGTQRTADGKVQFENDHYRITADDNNEVMIHNKDTGENYRIWGDPHVEVDGQHAFDFWGQTTFVLDDGTKVTIATTPWADGNNGATVASQVTILDGGGQYGVQIEGVDSNTHGDLGFVDVDVAGGDGHLETSVAQGNVLRENSDGSGFVAVDGDGRLRGVDQAFINATDEVKQRGSTMLAELGSMFQGFSGVMSMSLSGVFLSLLSDGEGDRVVFDPVVDAGLQFNISMVHA
jgi:hypothetical protein